MYVHYMQSTASAMAVDNNDITPEYRCKKSRTFVAYTGKKMHVITFVTLSGRTSSGESNRIQNVKADVNVRV